MSIIDKALGAITPPESEAVRAKATAMARAMSEPGDWLSLVLDHHQQINEAFEEGCKAMAPASRLEAMQKLARVLIGHSLGEEIVLYPALAKAGHKGMTSLAYTEQTTAKMQMAELERIDPATQDWLDKWEHIRGAVLHHAYEEERIWFPKLKQDYRDQAFLTRRFREEFERYVDGADRQQAAGGDGHAEERSFEPQPARDLGPGDQAIVQ
ncbi:MAG: hemerythrin domain-containing protein [Phenylobacterium sp.]